MRDTKLHGQDGSGNTAPLKLDTSTGALGTIGYAHSEVHNEDHYHISGTTTMANSAVLRIIADVPDQDKRAHMVFQVKGSNITSFQTNEAVTYSDGTTLTAYNNDRDSANTTTLTWFANPSTVTDEGVMIDEEAWGDNGVGNAVSQGGGADRDQEWKLKTNSATMFKITSGADDNIVSWIGTYYEHTDIT